MLIVIVIIGILATALIPRLTGMRQRAYDVAVKADIKNISSALELYALDHGTYTVTGGGHRGEGRGWVTHTDDDRYNQQSITDALSEKGYLTKGIKAHGAKSRDPLLSGAGYLLLLCDDGGSYSLSAKLHYPTQQDSDNISNLCHSPSILYYHLNYGVGGGS